MKWKENTAWRSRNGHTRQTDQIITRGCYVTLLLTQNYADYVGQSYILFDKIFCKMKQNSIQHPFVDALCSVHKIEKITGICQKSNFKKASLPMFIKHGDLGLVSCLHSPLDIFQQFFLKIFNSITLEISNWNYLVLLPPSLPEEGQTGQTTFGGLSLLAPIDFGAMDFMLLLILE